MEFPDILFESYYNETGKEKLCLVCGKDRAESYLRNMSRIIVPMCKTCGSDWNFHGYYILRRLKPKELFNTILNYKWEMYKKLRFGPSWYQILTDLRAYAAWGKKMKKFAKHM